MKSCYGSGRFPHYGVTVITDIPTPVTFSSAEIICVFDTHYTTAKIP